MTGPRPDLLELARTAAGLTQGRLAAKLNVTQGFVSQVERGTKSASASVVDAWAEVTNTPVEFFYASTRPVGVGAAEIMHRKQATMAVKPLKRAHAVANEIRLHLSALFDEVEVEPALGIPRSVDDLTPAEVAGMLRLSWLIPDGPLRNLTGYVEATGIPVIHEDLFDSKLSAISMPAPIKGWLIVLNVRQPADRMRFSLAHELGHIVLGHGRLVMDEEGISDADELALRSIEREADQFAAELLMPERTIKRELKALRFSDLGPMKQRWQVSMAALVHRAADLNAISESSARSLYIRIGSLPGGRRQEPGSVDLEEPGLVATVVRALEAEGCTRSDIAAVMCCSEETLAVRYMGERRKLRAVPDSPGARPVARLEHPAAQRSAH